MKMELDLPRSEDRKPPVAVIAAGILILLVIFIVAAIVWSGSRVSVSNEKNFSYMPCLEFRTDSGKEPAYTVLSAPEGAVGDSITDNQYEAGEAVWKLGGETEFSAIGKIKVRGNTSALKSEKKPYKLKLEAPSDFGRPGLFPCVREWVLINGTSLESVAGASIAELCGQEWVPGFLPVNLILNGDWKGCYYLTPSVGMESSRGLVGESGLLFENDAYWWKDEELSFRLPGQAEKLRITMSWPEVKSPDDPAMARLQNYLLEIEQKLSSGDGGWQDYIDIQSFASWILARDILDSWDGGEANMYYYKEDLLTNDPTSTKLKMGPLWDFEDCFTLPDEWSGSRELALFIPELLEQPEFIDQYLTIWKSVSPSLQLYVQNGLEGLNAEMGGELDLAWELDAKRWGTEPVPFAEQKDRLLSELQRRAEWMDSQLSPLPSD